MKILLKCVKRNFINITKWLRKKIPLILDDSEELVRRCQKKAIKSNGRIHKNAFYFGYHEISVDRSRYRSYKKTLQERPKTDSIDNWRLIKSIVQHIKPIPGVEEVKASPEKNNPAHALIICDSRIEKRKVIAQSLVQVFQKIPEEEYKI